jgi:hypothetical protein
LLISEKFAALHAQGVLFTEHPIFETFSIFKLSRRGDAAFVARGLLIARCLFNGEGIFGAWPAFGSLARAPFRGSRPVTLPVRFKK